MEHEASTQTIDARPKDDLFHPDATFESLGLHQSLLQGIEALGFERPTRVQGEIIPLAMAGRDILAQSRTGSGKTAAFGLPILHHLITGEAGAFSVLVLCPTRELAIQVGRDIRNYARFTDIKVVAVYGGQRMRVQIPKLKKNPHIIVGTPGRVMDFHRRGMLPYDKVRLAVLDEVDRMLDIGFRDDIRRILGAMKQRHHTIFVSATISPEIERLARTYLHEPEKLVLSSSRLTVEEVKQYYLTVERWDKNRLLIYLLKHEDPELTLVFCRTKSTVDGLTGYLQRKKIDAHAIHGDMDQNKRNRVMEKFRTGKLSVLVASDLAARGLDVQDISHVVNYDLPEDPEVYVHRIGRTARAGRQGIAWSLVTPEQGELLTAIERLTNVQIEEASYPGFEPGPVPPEVVHERQQAEKRIEAHRAEHGRLFVAPPVPDKAKQDPTKFPGGLVPTQIPAKRMGGRVRTRRR